MKDLIRLALPVVLTYLGTMAMGLVDLIWVGQINSAAIGAVGVGNSLFSWFLVFGLGLASCLEYLVSHAFGAQERDRQNDYLIQGTHLALFASVPLTLGLVFLSYKLHWLGVNPEVLESAKDYLLILSISLFAAYLFVVFRLYLTAMGIARPPMVILLVGNIVNATVGYVLVLGRWGAPSLGAVGAAWATLSSRLFMVLCLALYIYYWDKRNGGWIRKRSFRLNFPILKEMIQVGLPSSLQMTFEVGVFALATTLAARLSASDIAAHQIVLSIASMTFMVPLGVGSATAVMVGQSLGSKRFSQASRFGWKGISLGCGFMVVSCVFLLLFSNSILGFFTHDPEVLSVGKSIMLIAALFQLSDGTQTVGTGALRGLGETRSPMYFNLFGHWCIGLPVGIFLCFYKDWGLRGIWVGLSLGLTAVAIAVFVDWWRKSLEFSRKWQN